MIFGFLHQLSASACWLPRAHEWLGVQSLWILAQAEGPAAPGGAEVPANGAVTDSFFAFLANPLNLILISAILFMFIVARPQQKQLKRQQQALAALKKNDRIVTASGIHGVVVQTNVEEALVTIRIDENSGARMTLNRDAIAKITPSDSKE